MKASIEASEVSDVFRQALRGEIGVKLIGDRSWKDVWCGDVEYFFGTWRIMIFNDVMSLDYVDSVVAPDGRRTEYEDWFGDADCRGADPVDLLSRAEASALENFLENIEQGAP